MPFTPFHFGPGALVHSAAPQHISFLAFCGANVLVDVEPLYYMITGGYPIHRFFHTYVGATVAGVIFVLLFALVRRFALPLLKLLRLENLSVRAVALGAFAGTYSHVPARQPDARRHASVRAVQRRDSAARRGLTARAAWILRDCRRRGSWNYFRS